MPKGEQATFHAIIYAAGGGKERTCLKTENTEFCGPTFWEDDAFAYAQPDLGYPFVPRVLILGGGDGSQQDYIRLLTGCHPADLIMQLEAELKGLLQWGQAKIAILSAQDDAERHLLLHPATSFEEVKQVYKDNEERLNKELHTRISTEVNRLYGVGQDTKTAIDRLFAHMQDQRPFIKSVHLALRGDELTKSYALNRFLTLLLARYTDLQDLDLPSTTPQTFDPCATLTATGLLELEPLTTTQTLFAGVDLRSIRQVRPLCHTVTFKSQTTYLPLRKYHHVFPHFGIAEAPRLYETEQPLYRPIRMPHPPLTSLVS